MCDPLCDLYIFSPIDTYVPDYNQYPEFRQARAISFTQEAGEILIIPTGWFHQVLLEIIWEFSSRENSGKESKIR